MRVSCNPDDPGYANFRPGVYTVYLNGTQLAGVFTADEELGEVHVYSVDGTGELIVVDGIDGAELATQIIRGKVLIKTQLALEADDRPIEIAVEPVKPIRCPAPIV